MRELTLEAAPRSVLCLGAHCDDIELGCGGTLLRLCARYPATRVHWLAFCSDARRAAEMRASARAFLGSDEDVCIEGYRDGFLPHAGAALKERFEQLKRAIDPDLVFTHHRADRHQDHRTIAELTWNTFRDHLILEYEIVKYEGDLAQPNLFVPLSADDVARKARAIVESYPSQREKPWWGEETIRSLARLRGVEAGHGAAYAEAFHACKARLQL
jgi:LmbE family N-acetylglucosaminyl deacetylase